MKVLDCNAAPAYGTPGPCYESPFLYYESDILRSTVPGIVGIGPRETGD
jgi:hypothetical protein